MVNQIRIILFTSLIMASNNSLSQEVIKLPFDQPGSVTWTGGEKQYFSDIWNTEVVTNVSTPTMQVFKPNDANGTAVIIAPGGGLYALSIESEGNEVALWLNGKGITAFVLKYRLVPTGEDGVAELTELSSNNQSKMFESVAEVLPYSIKDGLNAIAHVRENADKYNIDPAKIGFMGFSAGGAVTMGVGYEYTETNRPDFLIPVYPWTKAMPVRQPPVDAPPMMVICASDDPLDLATGSVELYSSWLDNQLNAALHMYSKGGHGFGMRKQNLPSDEWIKRFYEWAVTEAFVRSD